MTAPTRSNGTPTPAVGTAPGQWTAAATVAGTELRRVVRDRTFLFFALVVPVAVIVVVGLTLGAAPDRLPATVVDLDGSASSARVVAALEAADGLEVRQAPDEGALVRDVRTEAVAAGVIVPAGFEDDLLSPEGATVVVVAHVGAATTPAARTAVEGAVAGVGVVLSAGEVVAATTELDTAAARAAAQRTSHLVPPVPIEQVTIGDADAADAGQFAYAVPANLTLFVFVNLLAAGGALAESRRSGVLRRMLAAPVTTTSLLIGIGASRYLLALAQAAVIVVLGALAFDVSWGDPWGAAALVAAWCAVGAGAGLLLGTVVRTGDRAPAVGIPIALGLAMLGGCMWPLESVGPTMQAVGHLTPHAWAMDGWIDLIYDGGDLADVAGQLAVLAAWAVVLAGLGTWRLRRSLLR